MASADPSHRGYLVAALAALVTLAIVQWLPFAVGPYSLMIIYLVPVLVAGASGGWRAGLLATILGLVAAIGSAAADGGEALLGDLFVQLRLAVYLALGIALSGLFEALHRSRRNEHALRAQTSALNARLQAVLASIPQQIFAIDDEFRYSYISDGVLAATGRKREEVLGRTIWEVYPETVGTALEQKVRDAVKTHQRDSFDFHYEKMGRWLEVHLHPSAVGTVLVVTDITDRKATEQALSREQELLQRIIDSIPVMITMYEPATGQVRLNQEFERVTGWTSADAQRTSINELCYPDPEYRQRVRTALENPPAGWHDVRLRTRDGRDLDTSWSTIMSGGRRIGIGLDMTVLRGADVIQARLAAIVESSDDAIIGKSPAGVITSWNAAAERLFGYDAASMIGRPNTTLIPSERFDEERTVLERLARGETIEPFETVRLAQDGRRVDVSLTISPVRDRSGRLVGAATVARDIGARKRSEQALKRSEAMLRDFFDNAAVGLHWVDADGIIQRANHAELEMLGYSEAEYVGHHIADFHVEQLAAGEFLRRMRAGQTILEYEARLRCKDGTIKHVLVSCNVLVEDGVFIHARCFTRDITDRKRAEQRLQAMLRLSERLNATLEIDGLLDVLVREALLLVGADAGYAGLRSGNMMVGGHFLQKGQSQAFEYRFAPGEGLAGWVLQHKQPYVTNDAEGDRQITPELRRRFDVRNAIAVPILGADNRVLGFFQLHNKPGGFELADRELLISVSRTAAIAMQNALTHRKVVDTEEVLREADRRKDEFLATLAHELRNPLAPIRNAIELFRMKQGLDADLKWGHEVIQRQVGQLARLVDDLLDMSRVSRGLIELRRGPVPVQVMIDAALETSRPLIEANGHALAIEADASLVVDGDITRLAQVLSNLLNNAAKYTPPGGRIVIAARRAGDELQLSVTDNGIGIPSNMLTRIFDMFAQVDRSLERTTGGLGIGLSLVQRLVELHGGNVEAHSAGPGKGSELVVTLPLSTAHVGALDPKADPIYLAPGKPQLRRVLVVDDNRDSANSLAMLLRVLGHEVDVAHDGVEAVQMASALKPHVVLLDIGLPKLNGYDVARRLRQMPWARDVLLVAVTGWGQDEDRQRSRESGFDSHLVKPVELAALQTLLAGQAAGMPRVTH